jgi:hypothetical protein
MLRCLARACALTLLAAAASAQSYYRDLDAGQPGRIEDAHVLPRYALGVYLSPVQFERLTGGTTRYRAEPKLAYGISALTEIELRIPMVELIPPAETEAASISGVAGMSIGISRALNVERTAMPAFALSSEFSIPVGSLSGPRGSFFAKGMATKTLGATRVHLNAGGGTFSVATPGHGGGDCRSGGVLLIVAGDTSCGPIVVFDAPCSLAGSGGHGALSASRLCMNANASRLVDSAAATPRTNGGRWFAGAAIDHTFPLQSTLVVADVFAERFVGLYPMIDWTTEIGIRHQLTPIVVVNASIARRFAGAITATSISGGASFEIGTPWIRR